MTDVESVSTYMTSRRHMDRLRRVATIAAIILLLGQMIAAVHVHRASSQQEFAASGAAAVADSSCALCAAQLHSPATAAVIPALHAPTVLKDLIVPAVSSGPLSVYVGYCFGRAPPASV